MFEAWGRVLYRRRRLALGLTLVLVAFAAVWGTGVFGALSSGDNFTPPASQSQREADQASQVFGRDDADVVVLYRSAAMTVSDPGYRQAVVRVLLVPATMRLLGRANWWAPRPLRRLYARYGIREEIPGPVPAVGRRYSSVAASDTGPRRGARLRRPT